MTGEPLRRIRRGAIVVEQCAHPLPPLMTATMICRAANSFLMREASSLAGFIGLTLLLVSVSTLAAVGAPAATTPGSTLAALGHQRCGLERHLDSVHDRVLHDSRRSRPLRWRVI